MEKVFIVGHLPKGIGGKQSSGLAVVIWELAKNLVKTGGNTLIEVSVLATDFNFRSKIDGVKIIGWKKSEIFLTVIKSALVFIHVLLIGVCFRILYRLPIIRTSIKMLFVHKNVVGGKPSVLHFHGAGSFIYTRLRSVGSVPKKIITIHGIAGQDVNIRGSKYMRRLEEKVTRYTQYHAVVFVSKKVYREWINYYGKPASPSLVVPNAFNSSHFYRPSKFNRTETDKIKLLSIGSISKRKGQARVLNAIHKFNNPDLFEYTCIGEGEPASVQELIELAQKKPTRLNLMGYKDPEDIRKLLLESDFMILPSSSEGFGLVFLESLACGIPVILPRSLPIVHENNILDKNNSILLNGSSIESIHTGLKSTLNKSFNNVAIAENVKGITWENIARSYLNIIKC